MPIYQRFKIHRCLPDSTECTKSTKYPKNPINLAAPKIMLGEFLRLPVYPLIKLKKIIAIYCQLLPSYCENKIYYRNKELKC